jgi:hypothetical protein
MRGEPLFGALTPPTRQNHNGGVDQLDRRAAARLRAAIEEANELAGPDRIHFDVAPAPA